MTNFEKIINRLSNLTPKQFAITVRKGWQHNTCPASSVCNEEFARFECIDCIGTLEKWLESEADEDE